DNALRHNRRRPNRNLRLDHARPHLPRPPAPGRRHSGLLHPPHPLHHRHHRDRAPALPQHQRHHRAVQQPEQLCARRRADGGCTGVSGAAEYLPELGGGVCVLDCRRRVFSVDDCFGVAGFEVGGKGRGL
ncbi:hypothetical protein LTR33_016297, partial [Friedmanniomyces endolithicus]